MSLVQTQDLVMWQINAAIVEVCSAVFSVCLVQLHIQLVFTVSEAYAEVFL